ncbi:hypothetical protein PENSPDRAFT_162054 [Peniophora sp. CONT]|nr:hypothetical protein PENSPDRAFT_162054 [Peniophora sp. CONT]
MQLFALFIAALGVQLVCAQEKYRLLHRLHEPSQTGTSFSRRAELAFSAGKPAIEDEPSFAEEWKNMLQNSEIGPDTLYQVALATSRGHPKDFSSVKACHLREGATENIVLHFASVKDELPYALDLFVSPIPHDGSCPPTSAPLVAPQNTTYSVAYPRHPPLPELRAPPPVTEQGEPVKPPEEKSFLQKYWIYIAIVMGAMLIMPGAPEEGQGGGGGGGGGRR